MKKIYPDLDVQIAKIEESLFQEGKINVYAIQIMSYIRVKHEGKWYLQLFLQKDRGTDPSILGYAMKSFTENVYLYRLYGKVNTSLTNSFGQPMFELDKDQRSEEERLQPFTKLSV